MARKELFVVEGERLKIMIRSIFIVGGGRLMRAGHEVGCHHHLLSNKIWRRKAGIEVLIDLDCISPEN